jgi:PKD repeat protein
MPFTYIRRAAVALALLAAAGCTVKNTEAPPLTGPSGLALTLSVNAIPDSISQDGGSQSSVKISAIGPDGKPLSGLPLRLDMFVGSTAQDFGTLSARSVVTNSDGVATAVYTAPPSPVNGVFGSCSGLPGNCVSIVATPTSTNFTTSNPERVLIRLVPIGVILPPANQPSAAFNYSPTAAVVGLPIQFDASASTPGFGATQITSYSWNFGDGSSGTGKNPAHTFGAANSYVVTLTVTNDRSLTASATQTLSVATAPTTTGTLPTAVFSVSPAAAGVGETIFFNASTSAPGAGHTITSYTWTFGDGTTGSGVTTTHVYTVAGSYSVQLKVTDDDGQAATSAGTSITVGSPPSPSASFTFSPATPGRFDQVVFDASSSSTAQGQTIVDVAWNFGDGTAVIHCPGGAAADCPGPTNRISAHIFQTATSFIVNLVVTDSAGRIASTNKTVSVDLALPKVVITASPSSPNPGVTVNFNSDATTYFSGSNPPSFPVSFAWTFGDGTGSTLADPSHAYGSVGTYTAGLSVTDNKGRTGVGNVSVNVVAVTPPAPPVADFTFGPSPASTGVGNTVTVNFTDTSSNPSGAAINSRSWSFGDGTSCSNAGCAPSATNPSHVYTNATGGTTVNYNATLTIRDTNNAQSTKTQTVAVTKP